jgi:hypothetical protein
MKNLNFIFIFIAVLGWSCSKDDMLNTSPNADQLSVNSAIKVCGSLITVSPGPNDTKTLTEAFAQAQNFKQKVVVKLMPGTFKIDMIEIRDFKGTISGSGRGKTIITNIPDLIPDAAVTRNKVAALLTFIGGDVSISDMSVVLSDRLPWLGGNSGGLYEMNMLLFSDYSADYTPQKKHIEVNLNNIEVTGLLKKDVTMDDGTIIDYAYSLFHGVKFAPDILDQSTAVLRSNIDATVNNCKFSDLWKGVYVWGCKSANLKFGIKGANTFKGNFQGLVINENLGVNAIIMNNEFTCPAYNYDGLDLNAGEAVFGPISLENVQEDAGTYLVQNNVFYAYKYGNSIGLWDSWRFIHPDLPTWMKINCNHNTINNLGDWNYVAALGLKNAVFSNNKLAGDGLNGEIYNSGLYWVPADDPNYLMSLSENCKILNNIFIQKNFTIYLEWDTQNYLILGDLTNVTVTDNGINNKVTGLIHPRQTDSGFEQNHKDRIGRIHDMYYHLHGKSHH